MSQQIMYFKMLVNSILTYLVINPECAVFLGQRWELHQLLLSLVNSQTTNTCNLGFSSLAGGAFQCSPQHQEKLEVTSFHIPLQHSEP